MGKVKQFVRKIALMLSSGVLGYALAHYRSKTEVKDWKEIAADANATSARAVALSTQRSLDRAARQEVEE